MLEGVFRKKYDYYIRVNENDRSYFIKRKPIYLFFEESKDGEFTDFVRHNIKYISKEVNSSEKNKLSKKCEEINRTYTYMKPEDYLAHPYWKQQDVQVPRIWYLDIETIDPDNRTFPDVFNPVIPITHIQLLDNKENKIWILMTKDLSEEDKIDLINKYKDRTDKEIKFIYTGDEIKLLNLFVKMIDKFKPTIITGWNARTFDFPYITKRMEYLGLDYKKLSPLKEVEFKEFEEFGKPALEVKWLGLYLFDLMEVFKKFAFMGDFKSFSLEYISRAVLGDERGGKVDYGEHKTIHNFFVNDYKGFCDYSILDVVLLDDIDNTIGLMTIIVSSAIMMGANFDDMLGTVKPWLKYLWHLGIEDGYVMPLDRVYEDTRPIKGGFVKEPVPGVYRWIASNDYNSHYPQAQISMNLSPDTYINEKDLPQEAIDILNKFRDENEDKVVNDVKMFDEIERVCKKYNICFAGLGFFSREKEGLLARTLKQNYLQRKAEKQKMLLAKAIP